MMGFLSSPLISYGTIILGVVLFSMRNKTANLIGCWFVAEFMCDLIVTGIGPASNADMVAYRYLYSTTSLLFAIHVLANKSIYPKLTFTFFMAVTVCTVLDGMFNWFARSHYFYDLAETGYVLSIAAMEAFIIYIGLKHVAIPNDELSGGSV